LDDPALKERITGPKSVRDQAQADAERTAAALESAGQHHGQLWCGGSRLAVQLSAIVTRVEVNDMMQTERDCRVEAMSSLFAASSDGRSFVRGHGVNLFRLHLRLVL